MMAILALSLALFSIVNAAAVPSSSQLVLQESWNERAPNPNVTFGRKLFGRFIHITDIHPDPHYRPGASLDSSCHRDKKSKKQPKAPLWGAARSECDSTVSLMNLTFQWLEEEWADKVDFVIWTGDNARHDNDHLLPRTPTEINELNTQTASHMERIFSTRGVPVIPSLGNNDIWPHNIMYPGPNKITNEMSLIWRPFIPFSSYQVFQRGAYYSMDIIPNQVGAISLNTLYWYDSNKAVEGCEKGQPGDLELDWLEVQLDTFRERDMQVWLSGHVPPSPGNYFTDCYKRYGSLALRYQDTILGHLFGHMNNDHFFWIDIEDIRDPHPSEGSPKKAGGDRYRLHDDLAADFKDLPKKSKVNLDDYAIVNVAPSVVPEYFPSVRIFTYNITGAPEAMKKSEEDDDVVFADEDEDEGDAWDDEVDSEGKKKKKKEKKKKGSKRKHGHRHGHKDIDCRLKKNRKEKHCEFKKPRYADPESPSRMNSLWSPLGYSQFYMPGLSTSNATHPPKYELEYVTYPLSSFHPPTDEPVPQHLLPSPLRNLTEPPSSTSTSTLASEMAPYAMDDLTILSWLKLARKLAETRENGKPKKKWKLFKKFMYMGKE